MHVLKSNYQGNCNIGLFGMVTEKHVLFGSGEGISITDKELEKVFGKPVERIRIAGSSLVGVFAISNGDVLMVPSIILPEEVTILEKLGYTVEVFKTNLTCLGNNILTDGKNAIIAPDFTEKEKKMIEKLLGVKAYKKHLAGVETPGSIAAMNTKGCLVSHEINDKELNDLTKLFNIEIERGSVNLGSPNIRSGMIVNDHGFLIGDESGGAEIVQADRVFRGE